MFLWSQGPILLLVTESKCFCMWPLWTVLSLKAHTRGPCTLWGSGCISGTWLCWWHAEELLQTAFSVENRWEENVGCKETQKSKSRETLKCLYLCFQHSDLHCGASISEQLIKTGWQLPPWLPLKCHWFNMESRGIIALFLPSPHPPNSSPDQTQNKLCFGLDQIWATYLCSWKEFIKCHKNCKFKGLDYFQCTLWISYFPSPSRDCTALRLFQDPGNNQKSNTVSEKELIGVMWGNSGLKLADCAASLVYLSLLWTSDISTTKLHLTFHETD